MLASKIIFRNINNIILRKTISIFLQNSPNELRNTSSKPAIFIKKDLPLLASSIRFYAKSKDKGKDKGKSNKTKVFVDETQLSEIINLDSLKNQMHKSIDALKDDFMKHVSVRSNTGSIESINVELDGRQHTLQELAQIVKKNPKMIVVNMSVFPQAIPAVLKAIQQSGMNLNPQQDGTTLFIPIPKVTTEHRENLVKNAKMLFIKYRDAIRDVQNKQVKAIKKKDKLSQDVARDSEQQIVAIADSFIEQAEKILESKQKELVGKD